METQRKAGQPEPRYGIAGHSMRSSTLMDGVVWNGTDPVRYAGGFGIGAA